MNYQGWQKLPQAKSVQYVFENFLSQIFKKTISIVGCGRTDTGVHASQFFFHADLETEFDFDLKFRLNKNLPADLAVFDIIPVEPGAHARFDAFRRTYHYHLHAYKDPFLAGLSSEIDFSDCNPELIRSSLNLLTTYNDFRAFCRHPDKQRTTICHVTAADFVMNEKQDRAQFIFSANRFLSGMIRILIDRILTVGKEKMTLTQFENYLIEKIPPRSLEMAPPQGLYLSKINYPYIDLPTRTDFLFDWKVV